MDGSMSKSVLKNPLFIRLFKNIQMQSVLRQALQNVMVGCHSELVELQTMQCNPPQADRWAHPEFIEGQQPVKG
jgi:hypothetical protein